MTVGLDVDIIVDPVSVVTSGKAVGTVVSVVVAVAEVVEDYREEVK